MSSYGAASNLLGRYERALRDLMKAAECHAAGDATLAAALDAAKRTMQVAWTCTQCGSERFHARGYMPTTCVNCHARYTLKKS